MLVKGNVGAVSVHVPPSLHPPCPPAIWSRSGPGKLSQPSDKACGTGGGHSSWVFSCSHVEAGRKARMSLTLDTGLEPGTHLPSSGRLLPALAEFLAHSKHSKHD